MNVIHWDKFFRIVIALVFLGNSMLPFQVVIATGDLQERTVQQVVEFVGPSEDAEENIIEQKQVVDVIDSVDKVIEEDNVQEESPVVVEQEDNEEIEIDSLPIDNRLTEQESIQELPRVEEKEQPQEEVLVEEIGIEDENDLEVQPDLPDQPQEFNQPEMQEEEAITASSLTLRAAKSSIVIDNAETVQNTFDEVNLTVQDPIISGPTVTPYSFKDGFGNTRIGFEVTVGDTFSVSCRGTDIDRLEMYPMYKDRKYYNLFDEDELITEKTVTYTIDETGEFDFRCIAENVDANPVRVMSKNLTRVLVKEKVVVQEEQQVASSTCYNCEPTQPATCTVPDVSYVENNPGYTFTVVCGGEGIGENQLIIKRETITGGYQFLKTFKYQPANANGETTFTYTNSYPGVYHFECNGNPAPGYAGSTSCSDQVECGETETPVEQDTQCDYTSLQTTTIQQGDDFRITCSGSDVEKYELLVWKPYQAVPITLSAQTSNSFVYSPVSAGSYKFQCNGIGNAGKSEDSCTQVWGTVEEKEVVCKDPITYLKVTSLSNNQVVSTSNQLLKGTVEGKVTTLEVYVNGTKLPSSSISLVNKYYNYEWSVNGGINLREGNNTIKVIAKNGDALCTEEERIYVTYKALSKVASCDVVNGVVVNPTVIENSGRFTVTCNGENIMKWQAKASFNGKTVDLGTKTDANDDDSEQFTYDATEVGNYTFNCLGWAETDATGPDPITCKAYGKVEKGYDPVCTDPVFVEKNIGVGEAFQITCGGTDIKDMYGLEVKTPSGQTITKSTQSSPNFTHVANESGKYEFTCKTRGLDGIKEPKCYGEGYANGEATCVEPVDVKIEADKTSGKFTVTCKGENIMKWQAKVVYGGGERDLGTKDDSTDGVDDQEVFTFTTTEEGEYTFFCQGRPEPGYQKEPKCEGTGTFTKKLACYDPVQISGTSHPEINNGGIIETTANQITIAGTYEGSINTVYAQIGNANGTKYYASTNTNNKTWTITLPVPVPSTEGTYGVWVKGISSEDANAPECNDLLDFKVKRIVNKAICVGNAATVEPGEIYLGGTFALSCEGSYVRDWKINVYNPQGSFVTTLNGDPSAVNGVEFFTYSPPVSGNYRFECEGAPQSGATGKALCDDHGLVKEKQYASCKDIIVNPSKVSIGSGVSITCVGENVESWVVDISLGGSPTPFQTLSRKLGNTATFNYTPTSEGQLVFTCRGEKEDGYFGIPNCSDELIVDTPECPAQDLVKDVKVTSHTNIEVVNTKKITISGTYQGDGDTGRVVVNNASGSTTYNNVTVNNGVRSVEIELAKGPNAFTVYIESDDELCGEAQGYGKVVYELEDAICIEGENRGAIVTPETIYEGDKFTITCEGEHIMKWRVVVKDENGVTIDTITVKEDVNDDDVETFEYVGAEEGIYTFECQGWGEPGYEGEPICDDTGEVVKKEYAICNYADVAPETVTLGSGFNIICAGQNMASWVVDVYRKNIPTKLDTLSRRFGNTVEFNYTPGTEGDYRFVCKGAPKTGYYDDGNTSCEDTGTVEENVCPTQDIVKNVKVTSHTLAEVVNTGKIIISGTYEGDGDEGRVVVNNASGSTNYNNVTVNNGVRSVEIELAKGPNAFTVYIESDDELCGEAQGYGKVVYELEDAICIGDKAKVTPKTIYENEKFTITCEGEHIMKWRVVVEDENGNVIDTLPTKEDVNDDDIETFEYVGAEEGEYTFECQGWSEAGYEGEPTCRDTGTVVKKGKAVCIDDGATVTPKVIHENEEFTIMCEGEHIMKWRVAVYELANENDQVGSLVYTTPAKTDDNDDDVEVFTYDDTQEGFYRFECQGRGEAGYDDEPTCDDTGTVKKLKEAECTYTNVNPEWIYAGDDFSVTCVGENVKSWEVEVYKGTSSNGQLVTKLPKQVDTEDDDATVFTYSPNTTGLYTFVCKAEAEDGYVMTDDSCEDTGTVKEKVCPVQDIVRNVTFDSHTYLQEVNSSTITVFGSYDGDVDNVQVTVKDQLGGERIYAGTVQNGQWTATVEVTSGGNEIHVDVSSADPLCGDDTAFGKVIYTPKQICEDPIAYVNITSPANGIEVNTGSVLVQGTFSGGVDQIEVIIRSNIGVIQTYAQINGNTWSINAPVSAGTNSIEVEAKSDNYLCAPKEDSITIYRKIDICEDPITTLTIDSHSYGELVDSNVVTVTGTIIGGYDEVGVQITDYIVFAEVNGNVWSIDVPVALEGTPFIVTAYPTESDCDPVKVNGLIKRQVTEKKSDPAIEVICETNNDMTCGGTMACTAYILNTTGAKAPAENLQAYLDIAAGNTIVSGSVSVVDLLQSDSLTCSKTSNDQIACNGRMEIGHQAKVTFDVKLAPCDCESSKLFLYEGKVESSNGDLNYANNYDSYSKTIVSGESCENQCPLQVGLTVSIPSNNTKTSAGSTAVIGRVDDASATVTVNGTVVSVGSNGDFSTTVSLNNGTNTFTIRAENQYDQCDQVITRTITREKRGTGGGGRKSTITCGDGIIDYRRGEMCDDGNYRNGDGCSSTCQIEEDAVCGNGILEIGEMCDDDNRTNGDGCDSTCELEDDRVRERIEKIKIEEVLTQRRKPTPLQFTPRVLPKTGVVTATRSSSKTLRVSGYFQS